LQPGPFGAQSGGTVEYVVTLTNIGNVTQPDNPGAERPVSR
jgi:hypothetical protein